MRIPTGDTQGQMIGQSVAKPGLQADVSANAHGAGSGAALEQLGNTGMSLAGREIAQQEQEAKVARAEAKRVKTLTTTATVQNGLYDLHDQLANELDSGKIDKTEVQSTWTERSKKLVDDALGGVDPEHRELVNATLLNDVGKFQRNIGALVQRKDKQDILSGGAAYFEEMQRYAARGSKEADAAISNVRTFWQATGQQAGLSADQVSKQVQAFTENVRARQATNLVNADPAAALKALKNPDYLPELDPDRRATLVQAADAAVLRNQQRAAIQAEAAARAQAKAWDAAKTVFDAGKMPTPEYAAQLVKTFKGSPYEPALKTMMEQGPANSAFVAQPLTAQSQTLIALQNKMNSGGATPEEIKQYEKLDKAHKATLNDIKADPYMAAAERGVLTKLEPLTLDLQKLPAQLVNRAQAAFQVSTWAGQEVSLFRPDEANKVADILKALPPKDRAGALSGLSKAMTPGQMVAFSKQLGAKDETLSAAALLAANNAKTSNGRMVSEIILAGADAAKEQRVKFPGGVSPVNVRAEIDKATRGAFLSEDANRAAGDAAFAIYQGLLAEGQTPDVRQVVNLATGGIMEMNGTKFVKPWGMKDGEVLDALRKFDAPQLESLAGSKNVVVGGKPVQVDDLAKHMPNATLGPSPVPGRYTVSVGGRFVATESGAPLLVPLDGGGPAMLGPKTHDGYPARRNPDGSHSTEVSITVTDERINGGKPTNIPSLWRGKELGEDAAIQEAVKSGRKYQSFNSIDEAVKAAVAKSAAGGANAGKGGR